MNLKLRNPLVVFDLETTGTNVVKDRIVEISVVKINPNGEKEIKTKKINPTIPIPIESSLIHGIYDDDVKDAPTFKQVGKEYAEFMKGADIGGFNVLRFDIPVLVEEFLRAGVPFDISNRKIVDAQKIFHMMEPRTLTAAFKFYCDKDLEGAHSAEADTLATWEVIDAQVKHYEGVQIKDKDGKMITPIENDMEALHKVSSGKLVDFAGRMVYNNEKVAVFNFGKYKGQSVTDVLKRDPGYYDWIQNNDFALNTKQKLTEIKLSMLKM